MNEDQSDGKDTTNLQPSLRVIRLIWCLERGLCIIPINKWAWNITSIRYDWKNINSKDVISMLNMLFLAAMTSNVGSIREDLILQKIYDANNKILLFFFLHEIWNLCRVNSLLTSGWSKSKDIWKLENGKKAKDIYVVFSPHTSIHVCLMPVLSSMWLLWCIQIQGVNKLKYSGQGMPFTMVILYLTSDIVRACIIQLTYLAPSTCSVHYIYIN